jgi:hypothetical protein
VGKLLAGATLNLVLRSVVEAAKADGVTMTAFSPHDLRRIGSTPSGEELRQSSTLRDLLRCSFGTSTSMY